MENIDDRAGTALKNQEEHADSLNGRIQELGATGKSIWNNIFDTGDFKNVVSMGTSLLGILDDITGFLGTWGTLGAGASIFAAFKNVGTANYISSPSNNHCFEIADSIVLHPMARIGLVLCHHEIHDCK